MTEKLPDLRQNLPKMEAKMCLLRNLIKDSDLKRRYHHLSTPSQEQMDTLVQEVKVRASKLDTQLD